MSAGVCRSLRTLQPEADASKLARVLRAREGARRRALQPEDGLPLERIYNGNAFLPEYVLGDDSLDDFLVVALLNRLKDHIKRYPSRPLCYAGTELRVLHLLPGEWQSPIYCELEIVDLNDRPSYEAVSYTWGASNADRFVAMHGCSRFPITDNVFDVLQRLRYNDRVRTLWIDCLCINQGDIDERAQQVAIMGEIYAASSCCLVWLGEHDSQPGVIHLGLEAGILPRSQPGHEDVLTTLDYVYRKARPSWWERAWVVQEVVLAPEVQVCFAKYQMSWLDFGWEMLRSGFDQLDRIPREYRYPGFGYSASQFPICPRMYKRFESISLLRLQHRTRKHESLCEFLRHMQLWACSDRRDMVYSVRSLVDQREAALFEPDYGRPWVEIWARATFSTISSQQTLDVWLQSVRIKGSADELYQYLPSWAINFDFLIQNDTHALKSVIWHGWTMEEEQFDARMSYDAKCLTLRGSRFDTVASKHTLAYMNHVADSSRALLSILFLYVTADNVRTAYQSFGDDPPEVVAEAAPPTGQDDRLAKLMNAVNGSTTLGVRDALDMAFDLWSTAAGSPREFRGGPSDSHVPLFWKYSAAAGRETALIRTTAGFIGLAPNTVEAGDEIALMSNYQFPVLVRPSSEEACCQFVGLAYVHGIMYDELKLLKRTESLVEKYYHLQ